MPLLDIATSQASCGNHICGVRAQLFVHGRTVRKITFRKDKKLSSTWKVSMPRKVNLNVGHLNTRDALLIRAVYTLEQKHLIQTEDGEDQRFLFNPDSNLNMFQSPSETSSETEEKERLRRMRISSANKGNVPWNKGRKHSPETLRRIRERTRIAMQDPKVKMKLVNLGHAQTEETRVKIGVGVRMGWKRRRERLMVQETCCYEWQNLVAEASRKGYVGEEELQWDSYRMLDKQLEQEWLDSIEKRKATPRTKGNKRAPKSAEQRKKISDAISAKWNDPEYRERVCAALEKYHGTPIGSSPKRTPRRRQSGDSESGKSPVKRKSKDSYYDYVNEKKNQTGSKPKRRAPKYKDPLAGSKLEMLKSIKAQRMEMETKKVEAMERARLLITEAKKAAQALEEAAMTSPLARASLIETRKLIAEATRSIEAAESGQVISHEKDSYSPSTFNGQVNQFREEAEIQNADYTLPNVKEVNGTHVRFPNNNRVQELEFGETAAGDVNQIGRDDQETSRLVVNGTAVRTKKKKMPNTGKKWIRGRLVEVSDSDERVEQEE